MKQVIILRADLGMSAGKAAAQACHASLMAFLLVSQIHQEVISGWFESGQGKIILEVQSLEELQSIYSLLKNDEIGKGICYLVRDSGLTEFNGQEYTALGLGPFDKQFIDAFTGKLKLYK